MTVERTDFDTAGGLRIRRTSTAATEREWRELVASVDRRPGGVFECKVTYPGRYVPWRLGFADPYVAYESTGADFRFVGLRTDSGPVLAFLYRVMGAAPGITELAWLPDGSGFTGSVETAVGELTEEERTRRPTAVEPLRATSAALRTAADPHLGWYCAFGYELLTQWDPIEPRLSRPDDLRTVVAYLPGRLLAGAMGANALTQHVYRFGEAGAPVPDATADYVRTAESSHSLPGCVAGAEAYQAGVRDALACFHRGELFEVVLSQTITRPVRHGPAVVYHRLTTANPSPYQFLINLGRGEFLVGASPEMFVRVRGNQVETCPISGTISRGKDALGDTANIMTLLGSEKDEAELTMCTDVDRNDKSRVCRPGTVEIIGRRQIELYSRLIHTVDHVQGRLRPDRDAWDAFLSHMWAVTVTGAPKRAATQFIEDHESSARRWYGGAVGVARFDGSMDTGLTLRAARVCSGVAEIRVGATLLVDSDPEAEELETRLKASAVIAAIENPGEPVAPPGIAQPERAGLTVLVVDHEDSFVHTLADYFQQAGCVTTTRRWGFDEDYLDEADLLVLSPGPGRPSDFAIGDTIERCLRRGLPVFGVCLGLQGIVEHFGGRIGILPRPVHGRGTKIEVTDHDDPLFSGVPPHFVAGRYHSLHARPADLPDCLRMTAQTDDGVVMAVRHHRLPLVGVQFHPESLLSLDGRHGHRIVSNVVAEFGGLARRGLVRSSPRRGQR
ncbi:MAG TPA: anthranilate synthase component I [Amycolatopsis sp.]|nr:anthranilate synthase component I [Amycolatopsis sp.]